MPELIEAARSTLAQRAGLVLASSDPVPSPCSAVCKMNPAGDVCVGCLRSLAEISTWSRMTADQQRGVWALIAQRATEFNS